MFCLTASVPYNVLSQSQAAVDVADDFFAKSDMKTVTLANLPSKKMNFYFTNANVLHLQI